MSYVLRDLSTGRQILLTAPDTKAARLEAIAALRQSPPVDLSSVDLAQGFASVPAPGAALQPRRVAVVPADADDTQAELQVSAPEPPCVAAAHQWGPLDDHGGHHMCIVCGLERHTEITDGEPVYSYAWPNDYGVRLRLPSTDHLGEASKMIEDRRADIEDAIQHHRWRAAATMLDTLRQALITAGAGPAALQWAQSAVEIHGRLALAAELIGR